MAQPSTRPTIKPTTHLSTPKGWKAELAYLPENLQVALVVGHIDRLCYQLTDLVVYCESDGANGSFAAAAVVDEDTGNYTCELRGPESQVLRQVTHYLFVRGNPRLPRNYLACPVRWLYFSCDVLLSCWLYMF